MKVLHLVASLGAGGAEKQLYLLCRDSASQVDHRVVAIREEGRWADPIRSIGVRVDCLNSAIRAPAVVFRLRGIISRIRPAIVHCWLPSANILGVLAGWPAPVIASVLNVDDWKPWTYRMADRFLSRFWSAVLCNSYAGAEWTIRSGIPREKVYTIPNGLDSCPPSVRVRSPELTICLASRLVPQKQVDLALRVAARVPAARFLIAGDGPLRPKLEAQAPANVRFLGHLDDVSPVYARSDIFLSTSVREGTSNSLMEAMQAGCVPVVTPAGDNARIVTDGISGRVVSPERMPEAILEVEKRLDELSEQARQAAGRLGAKATADETVRLYQRLLSNEIHYANPLPGLHQ